MKFENALGLGALLAASALSTACLDDLGCEARLSCVGQNTHADRDAQKDSGDDAWTAQDDARPSGHDGGTPSSETPAPSGIDGGASSDGTIAPLPSAGEVLDAGDGGSDAAMITVASELAELGSSCGAGPDCLSEHCIDGICCEQECAPVDCDGAFSCFTSRNITKALCGADGRCVENDKCEPVTMLPEGSKCERDQSPFRVCDGQGQCVEPSVQCDDEVCETGASGNMCCLRAVGSGVNAPACQSSCDVVNLESASSALCDQHTDCGGPALCCLVGGRYTSVAECTQPSDCNWSDTSGGAREVCQSPAMELQECSNGGVCNVSVEEYVGWLFCSQP